VRYALLVDAVDQLSDGGADLGVLQKVGSDGVVVVSVAGGTRGEAATKGWERIEVKPLEVELRERMIQETLSRYRKVLPEGDGRRLAEAPQSGSPLYLGLALEELRVDAHHETLTDLVTEILEAQDAQTLLLRAFLLDPDYSREEQPDLAVRFMALIGAARQGLTEERLGELLALEGEERLPRAALSHLLHSFGPFLLNKGDRRAPMHRMFGEAALGWLGEEGVREYLYARLAPGEGEAEGLEGEGVLEGLYQLTVLARREGERRGEFEGTLRRRGCKLFNDMNSSG
jgi:hypothetical protein